MYGKNATRRTDSRVDRLALDVHLLCTESSLCKSLPLGGANFRGEERQQT